MAVVRGLNRALDILNSMANEHPRKLKEQTRKSAYKIANDAKREAPLDTGMLKQSIVVELKDYNASITANADYAAFQEFGTGTKVSVPDGFEYLASPFKRGNKRNMKAQPYLIPAFLKEIQNYKNECKKILNNQA